jgi:hypothetical protein
VEGKGNYKIHAQSIICRYMRKSECPCASTESTCTFTYTTNPCMAETYRNFRWILAWLFCPISTLFVPFHIHLGNLLRPMRRPGDGRFRDTLDTRSVIRCQPTQRTRHRIGSACRGTPRRKPTRCLLLWLARELMRTKRRLQTQGRQQLVATRRAGRWTSVGADAMSDALSN